jgi:DNA modification methylase
MDIKQSNTLNRKIAREENDERHIAPLQLDLIQRCLRLWSNPGDVVFSPFAGIGSEGFVSLQMNRRFVGIELKKSYFDVAVNNLKDAKSIPLGKSWSEVKKDLAKIEMPAATEADERQIEFTELMN